MLSIDPRRAAELLQGFAQSPLQLALFILAVLAFIGLPLWLSLRERRRGRRERARRAWQAYERRLENRDLSGAERDLLDRMAGCLQGGEEPRLLAEHLPTFDAAAERLRRREGVADEELAALRVKLGLRRADPERAPRSSSELPEGLPVRLLTEGRPFVPATLAGSGPSALRLSLPAEAPRLPPGSEVEVHFDTRAGSFFFATRVTGREGDRLELAHVERIRRVQRRLWYRRRVRLAARVRPAGSPEPAVAAILLDLGGGGASLENPGGRFRAGEELELEIPLPEGSHPAASPRGGPLPDSPLRVRGRLLRVSGGGRVLHLVFEGLADSERDRLLRYLLRRPA